MAKRELVVTGYVLKDGERSYLRGVELDSMGLTSVGTDLLTEAHRFGANDKYDAATTAAALLLAGCGTYRVVGVGRRARASK